MLKNLFTQWVVGNWNALPAVVEASVPTIFQTYLVKHMNHLGIEDNRATAGEWD